MTEARIDEPGDPDVPGGRHSGRVEAGGQPRERHRPIEVPPDILLPAPDELHRDADLLCDQHRLPHEILDRPAPAEAAAGHRAVDHDVAARQAGGIGRGRQRGLAVLGRRPDLDPVGPDMGGAVLRLHGGMREERNRYSASMRRAEAASAALTSPLRRPTPSGRASPSRNAPSIVSFETCPLPPKSQVTGSASIACCACHQLSATTATASAQPDDAPHALAAHEPAFIDRAQAALEHRALPDRRVEHIGQTHVDPVDRPRRDLVQDIEAFARRADELPVLGFLQPDMRGRRDGGGRLAQPRRSGGCARSADG